MVGDRCRLTFFNAWCFFEAGSREAMACTAWSNASGSGDGSHANAVKVVLFVEAASAGAGLSTHRRGEGKERQRKAACSYTRGVATGHLRSHEFFLFS
jgi:hypothetical protein